MLENNPYNISQCHLDLENQGYCLDIIPISPQIKSACTQRDWTKLDQLIWDEISEGGIIYNKLKSFCDFSEIEFIISLREEHNEDGIWHDDGSRILAFSLSLTFDQPEGGVLEIRKKGELNSIKIPTPAFGEIIIFKTGQAGYEHKINKVLKGSRLIIAGWCYA